MTSGDIEDVLALSPLQLGLFSLATMAGSRSDDPYVITMAADVVGPLDTELLRGCAATMLVRHPNLRASFWHRDLPRPVQIVPSRVEPPWRHARSTEDRVAELEEQERRRPFDLEYGPLIRFVLIEMPFDRWRFVVIAHHIVIDGWSLPLFVGEMLALYRADGDAGALPPRPRPYRDYLGWLADRDRSAGEQLWREHLAGLPGPTLLAPALGGDAHARGLPGRVELTLDRDATDRLIGAARARGLTFNTVVQTAWGLVLSRMTDRADVVFGVTVSGRPPEIAGIESMVGLFINTVPLRVRIDPNHTVAQCCSQLQRNAALLREHAYLSHAELRALGAVGDMFDTLLVYENFPSGGLAGQTEFPAGDVTFRPTALESLSHFPVTIAAHVTEGRLTLLVEVIDGALGATTPDSLGRRILATLPRLMAHLDRPIGTVSVLLDSEQTEPTAVAAVPSGGGVQDRFAQTASRYADAVALSWGGGCLTYAEVDTATDRLAGLLRERGTRSETAVAISLPRGPDYVVAMLAILKAGGVCVPLEPEMPVVRVASILAQSGACLIVDDTVIAAARTRAPASFRSTPTHPGQAAYTVFTSGTTGEPKGVIGTHDALLAYADDHIERVLTPAANRLARRLRIAHAWSFTFDAAWQPLVGLLDGHSVHVVGDTDRRDAEALVRIIGTHRLDMLDVTPSMFTQLRQAGLLDTVALTELALGGEAIDPASWTDIRTTCAATGAAAHNCYGPTETTVEALVATIGEHVTPTIGRPTRGTRVAVLDSGLRPVPDGAVGELYVSGAQLTRGYLGRAAETASRYVATAGGARMYRTGDLVRWQPEGSLQFLGRADAQIQIRGHRVEPAEIEAALAGMPGVSDAHVTVGAYHGAPRLIAYVAGDVEVAELRAALRLRLPRYMVPHRIVGVQHIPLTGNGKVDDSALAVLNGIASASAEQTAVPTTATEMVVAEIIAEHLDVSDAQGYIDIDIDADLLELGIDSIVALSVVQAGRRRGLPMRARLLLECGSVRELAAALDNPDHLDGHVNPDLQDEPAGPIPVLPNVHWLYEHGDPRRLAQVEAIPLPDGVTAERLQALLDAVLAGHEVLRSRLDRTTMMLVPDDGRRLPLTEVQTTGDIAAEVGVQTLIALDEIDPETGPLVRVSWLHPPGEPGVLLLVAHVLALDPASWRILLGEVDAGWHALAAGLTPAIAREHTSYRGVSDRLIRRAAELDTVAFWLAQLDGDDPNLGARRIRPGLDLAGDWVVALSITGASVTAGLLGNEMPMQHLLTMAAARTVAAWRRRRGQPTGVPLLALETHGRADAFDDATDTSDTVGLFSAIYPLRVRPDHPLPEIPGRESDFGLLRYLRVDTSERLTRFRDPQLLLNYLGRTDIETGTGLRPDRSLLEHVPPVSEPNAAVRYELTMTVAVLSTTDGPVLATQWRTLPDILGAAEVAAITTIWQDQLAVVAGVMR